MKKLTGHCKKYCALLICMVIFNQTGWGQKTPSGWQNLLDKNLSNFDKFIGVPDPSVKVPGYSEENRKKNIPIGLNNDPLGVFTVKLQDGVPVLHISGQLIAGLSTKKEYQNYHLKFKFKWGEAKYAPRLNQQRDNGVVYHATGPHGKFWNAWMRGHEMQIQEKDMGDYYGLSGAVISIPSVKANDGLYIYTPGASPNVFREGKGMVNRCRRSEDFEKPHGEWNELELICFEDKSIHIVNGHVVMVLDNSKVYIADDDMPSLQKGKIQFQSEAAEAFYKNIQIKQIKDLPKEYSKYF